MNATQPYGAHHQGPYMESHHPHYPPTSGTPYSHYQQSAPLYQPSFSTYAPHHAQYHYAYSHPVTPPQSATHHASHYAHQPMGLPGMASAPPSGQAGQSYTQQQPQQQHVPDTTGQKPPPGMKPKVTATLWEDEGTLCFQVEVDGICVARREDNHMINGTKLLNVAQMTRGRRDGILKSEKSRNVVKIGPMHLKGVWIPFERALEFANKEKITERLYPLFVSNVGALLHQPTQSNATGASRRNDSVQQSQGQSQSQPSQPSQPPQQHQSHQRLPQTTQPSTVQQSPSHSTSHASHSHTPGSSHGHVGRPGLDRAHTFPTPPVSATGGLGYGGTAGHYEYASQTSLPQSLALDTGLSNARSLPTSPAATPPENALQSMQQSFGGQTYDSSRHVYSNSSQDSSYGAPTSVYGHTLPSQLAGHPSRDESKHQASEHDTSYGQAHSVYSDRYTYSTEHAATSTLKDSPKHSGSGRATPRTLASSQPHWPSQYGDRSQQFSASSNMYMSSTPRGASGAVANGYPSQYSNGFTSNKRGRELDDHEDPYARSDTNESIKRRKTMGDDQTAMHRPATVHHH